MKVSNHYFGLGVLLLGLSNLGANGCGAPNGTGCDKNSDCQEGCGQGRVCHQVCTDVCPAGESCSQAPFTDLCACTPAASPGCPDSCPPGQFCHPDYFLCVAPALPGPTVNGDNKPALNCPYGGPTDNHTPQCFDPNWNACRPEGSCTAQGALDGGVCTSADGGISGGSTTGGSNASSNGGSNGGSTSGSSNSSGSSSSGGSSNGGSGTSGGGTTATGGSSGSSGTSSGGGSGCATPGTSSDAPLPVDAGSCNGNVAPSQGFPLGDLGAGGGPTGNELDVCTTNADCDCPLSCVQDLTLARLGVTPNKFCERPCVTVAECDRIDSACVGGFCTPNACSGSGFQVGGPCNALGCGDGTCTFVPFGSSGYFGQFCLAAGQGTFSCNATQVTIQPGYNVCVQGSVCQTTPSGASCEACCTVPGPACAGTGQACFPYPQSGAYGLCAACLTSGSPCDSTLTYANQECCSGTCQVSGTCL